MEKYIKKEEVILPDELKYNPYKYICNYYESLYPHVGKKVFRLLSLIPCSLIIPKIPRGQKLTKQKISALIIGNAGTGKTTIAEAFEKITYNPLFVEHITEASFFNLIKNKEFVTLITSDIANSFSNEFLVKLYEQILGEEGCCMEDSFVQMSDGTIKKIQEIKIGDKVISFNRKNMGIEESKVINTKLKTTNQYYKIKTRTSEIKVTPEHKFFILKKGEFVPKRADKLDVGDTIPIPRKLNFSNTPPSLNFINKEKIINITDKGRQLINEKIKRSNLSNYEISRMLGQDVGYISRLIHSKMNLRKNKKLLLKLFNILGIEKGYLEEDSYFFRKIKIPNKINSHFSEFLGEYWGDGNFCIKKKDLYIKDKCLENLIYYKDLIEHIFNAETKITKTSNQNSYALTIFNPYPLFLLLKKLGLKKSKQRNLPEIIYTLKNKELSAFIRGYFDAESSVRISYGKNKEINGGVINLETSCEDVVKQLKMVLLRFQILSTVRERKRYDKRFKNPCYKSYQLIISDKKSIHNFSKKIGFNHPEKKERLYHLIKTNKDKFSIYYRYDIDFLGELMIELGTNTNKIFFEGGIRINEFKNKKRKIPLKTLSNLYNYLKNQKVKEGIWMNRLKKIIKNNNHLVFDEIVSIDLIEDNQKKFYDLSLDKNFNFIANGLFTHNSISRVNMRNINEDLRRKIDAVAYLSGTPENISHEILGYGLLSRMSPIIIHHTEEEHEEILDFVNEQMGVELGYQQNNIPEFYQELLKIQKGENNEIPPIIGYNIPESIKKEVRNFIKPRVKPSFKRYDITAVREVEETYRFLVSHSFLNIFSKWRDGKVLNGRIDIDEQDLKVAKYLIDREIKTKSFILECINTINKNNIKTINQLIKWASQNKQPNNFAIDLMEGMVKK